MLQETATDASIFFPDTIEIFSGTAYTVRYALKNEVTVFNASSWDLRQLGVKA